MKNLKKLNDAHGIMQWIAGNIIDTQEALANLRDETEKTLELSGLECRKAEKILEEMMLDDGQHKGEDEELNEAFIVVWNALHMAREDCRTIRSDHQWDEICHSMAIIEESIPEEVTAWN